MRRCGLCLISLFFTSSQAFGKEITIGFSFAKPPYVFAAQFENLNVYDTHQNRLGIEIDLVKASFDGTDITFKPVFDTFYRVVRELGRGHMDAAETAGPGETGIYYSQPLIGCENYAITKGSAKIKINTVDDLQGKSIVAWQGASTDLGAAFQRIMKDNANYSENHDQQAQYKMFRVGRVDVVVIDKYIFEWWDSQFTKQDGKRETYDYHPIFPGVNEYRLAFHSKELRDLFDAGLQKIRKNGHYEKIIRKYIDHGK